MKLSEHQLNEFLGVLDRIDRGKAMPRFADRLGRFLRQYKDGRLRIATLLNESGAVARRDGAISGAVAGAVELHPLVPPRVGVLGFPLGEVADTLAISEELGGTLNVVMWLKSPMANAANEILKTGEAVRLDGDYRWTPPARISIGAASVGPINPLGWAELRCIKTVADDLQRPPHALEYSLDYRLGSPSIKFFRSVCVVRRGNDLVAAPALGEATVMPLAGSSADTLGLRHGDAMRLLVYREPWNADWTVVDSVRVALDECFRHVVEWLDYQRELIGETTDSRSLLDVRTSWAAAGFRLGNGTYNFNTDRRLLPVARAILRELRRI